MELEGIKGWKYKIKILNILKGRARYIDGINHSLSCGSCSRAAKKKTKQKKLV